MDPRLVGWARAVKSRRRATRLGLPPLWLFTDPARMPDLSATVRNLPKGLCGVVFRHDAWPARATLARQIARICRDRRLALSIAGTRIMIPGAARHLRAARGPKSAPYTASAHDRADLVRARGAIAVFLSPIFPTGSHPNARPLGLLRWTAMARHPHAPVLALGGVNARTARKLPRHTPGAAAIEALL